MEYCSYCQKNQTTITVRGKRLVTIAGVEQLVPYRFCDACSAYLRSMNDKAYNNVLNDEMETLKLDFWVRVEQNLREQQCASQ